MTALSATGRERSRAWMDAGILFLIAALIRVFVCGRIHHISSDEFFYTIIARDIYRIWTGQLQATVHGMDTLHPGGFSMLLAVVFLITGKPLIAVGQHFSAVVSSLTVVMTYWMAREAVGHRWIAFTAAVVMAFIPAAVRDSDRVYTDNLATLLITMSMAFTFRSWRTGRVLPWVWACITLGAAFLTKEYMLFLAAPALGLGSLVSIRRHRWTYWVSVVLVFIAVFAGIWYLQIKSTMLPQASYLLAELNGERQDYVGRTAPDVKKLMSQHLAEPDIPLVFLGLAVVGYVVLLRSLRKPVSALPDGATDSNAGAVAALIVLPLTFCLFFSMFRNLWGVRLVFPSFPAICVASAAGLLAGTGIAGLIGFIGIEALTYLWIRMHPGLWAGYQIAVYSIPLAAFLVHAARPFIPRLKIVRGLQRTFSYTSLGVLILACTAPGIARMRFDLRTQAACNDPHGPQFGMFKAAGWIRRNIKPDENVLTCNPRQMAYFGQSTYAHLIYAPWWINPPELTEPAALREYEVKWVLINQPEIKPDRANRIYRSLKSRPDMREEYSLFGDDGVVLAVFRVRGDPR